MIDRDKAAEGGTPDKSREPTKPAGEDVAPPDERVDDEVGSDQGKKTQRQE